MIGKRVLARLQGKTLGACHKCGGSLKRGRSCLRAKHCVRCNTSYHTYDCGNRMAAVLLADSPAECPKCRNACRCASGPLECHAHRTKVRKAKKLSSGGSSITRNDTGKSENDEARRNIERSTAVGKDVLCSPTGHSLASFEVRVGAETAVPLLEQAQTFAAMHAAASESSSSESRHDTRVLRRLRKRNA